MLLFLVGVLLLVSAGTSSALAWMFTLSGLVAVGAIPFLARRYGLMVPSLHDRTEILFQQSPNPIQVLNGDGTVLRSNSAFLQWSGYNEDELAVMPPFGFARQDPTTPFGVFWKTVRLTLIEGLPWTGEIQIVRKDGSTVAGSISISPIINWRRKLVECVVTYSDFSERWELTRKLQESQEKYRNIVESSLDGIVIVQDGKLVFINASAAKIFGYESVEEMQMIDFTQTVAPASRPFVWEAQLPKPAGEDIFRNYEMKGLTKQGKIIDLEVNARLVGWNGKPAVLASLRDVTDRKMLERDQALWLWEQETLSAIDRKLVSMVGLQNILDAIANNAKALTRADFAGVLMLEGTRPGLLWRTAKGNVSPVQTDVAEIPLQEADRFLKGEPLVLSAEEIRELARQECLPLLRAEGIQAAALFPLEVEHKVRGRLVIGFRSHHDLTGREMRLLISLAEKSSIALANAELYENLVQHEEELRFLSGARVEAQEEERRRIAREIHDSLGQLLTAIKFNVEILQDEIVKGVGIERRIEDVKDLLDSAMAEAREISYNLMPSVLEDFGLGPALQLLCEQFNRGNGLKLSFHAHGLEKRLEPMLEVGLYRIAQEALNNITKHAQAMDASLQIVRDDKGVRLTIEDSGVGFSANTGGLAARLGRGMGLMSMRERAASFHGTLTIDSKPHAGTVVIVEIPLTENAGS
jgi:PAS domain S-box-containing protein